MNDGNVSIREMTPEDWPLVQAIYEEGIATGDATFEEISPEWTKWDAGHLKTCRLVAVATGTVVGWAALSPVSQRCVYAGVAEVSVYVSSSARNQGIGRRLLEMLVVSSEREGLWTLQAGIFPENAPSIAVHRQCGFRIVGTRERIGRTNSRWRDVLLLERRSTVVGT